MDELSASRYSAGIVRWKNVSNLAVARRERKRQLRFRAHSIMTQRRNDVNAAVFSEKVLEMIKRFAFAVWTESVGDFDAANVEHAVLRLFGDEEIFALLVQATSSGLDIITNRKDIDTARVNVMANIYPFSTGSLVRAIRCTLPKI